MFMRPCVGVVNVCPPLCSYKELRDGTYTLADVARFNMAIDELIYYKKESENV